MENQTTLLFSLTVIMRPLHNLVSPFGMRFLTHLRAHSLNHKTRRKGLKQFVIYPLRWALRLTRMGTLETSSLSLSEFMQ
jgi:hypothetical protein